MLTGEISRIGVVVGVGVGVGVGVAAAMLTGGISRIGVVVVVVVVVGVGVGAAMLTRGLYAREAISRAAAAAPAGVLMRRAVPLSTSTSTSSTSAIVMSDKPSSTVRRLLSCGERRASGQTFFRMEFKWRLAFLSVDCPLRNLSRSDS